MAEISDEYMQEQLGRARAYTVVLLRSTELFDREKAAGTIREHARRNFALRADGLLPVVLPVTGDADLRGVSIFDAPPDEVRRLMDDDPAVRAGIFTYEVHPAMSFPGDALP